MCRYFLSNWLLALGRKKDDDEFVRRDSQGLQMGAFLRVPAVDRRHVRLKKSLVTSILRLYLVQLLYA